MKTVYVMRHAKAKEHALFGKDKDRKLSDTGISEVTIIAQQLSAKIIQPIDAIITSDAKRTLMTTKIVAANITKTKIIEQPLLYNAPMQVFYEVLLQLPNNIASVLIIAHNPGITHFVNSVGIAKVDNMPTSGVFGFNIVTNDWLQILDAPKEFLYFDCPGYEQ
jgi:phosphohistidine phosphatase